MNIKVRNILRGGVLCAFLISGMAVEVKAQILDIYAPPAAGTNFNGNSLFSPFDPAEPGRFQQVCSSTAFSALPPEGGLIFGFCFRVDRDLGHSFDAVIPDLQLNLSTTSRSVDNLSTVFSDNVGQNDRIVSGRGSLLLGGAGGGGFTGFNVCFDFHENPFYYNPANGNLLLDFRIYQGFGLTPRGTAILDAFDSVGDSVSSVYGVGSIALPTSGQLSSLGLATDFVLTPVPEPSTTIAIFAMSLLFLGSRGWKRMKGHKEEPHVTA